MNSLSRRITFAAFALTTIILTGCPSTPPAADEHAGHNHAEAHKHPTTLAGAHEQLDKMGADIKAAFESGSPDDAHAAMHEIGHVILLVPKLAKEAGVEAADEAQQAADDLMASFEKLDHVMHGGDEVAWSDVSEKIDAAMAKIEGWLPEDAGHQHDEHEHGHDEHGHDGEGHDHSDHQ